MSRLYINQATKWRGFFFVDKQRD